MPSLTPIIYAVVGVIALVSALLGLSRGLYRQGVRTVTIVVAAVLSFIAVGLFYSSLSAKLDGMTVTDLINILVERGIVPADTDTSLIENLDMQTAELILALPLGLVVAPLLFVICFIVSGLILLILHIVICALCGFKSNRNNFLTRVLGLILGLFQGLAIAGLILMPLIGIGNMAKDTLAVLEEEAPEEELTKTCSEYYYTYADEFVENPAIKMYSTLGINALYEKIATVDVDDKTDTKLTAIAPDAALVAKDVFKLKGADMNNLTAEDEEALNSILETIDNDPYLGEMLSGVLRATSSAYSNGDIAFNIEDPFSSIIAEAAKIFSTSSRENVTTDIKTITDVILILSRDGVLSSFNEGSDAMLDALTAKDADGNTTVNKVITTIRSNERTKPLVTVITKISLSVMSDQAGIDEDVVETFENIKESINNDVLSIKKENYETEEEYVAEVSTAIDTMLKDNAIELEKDIVDTMAEYVADNFSDIDHIDEDEVNDIILSYYEAYLKSLETPPTP